MDLDEPVSSSKRETVHDWLPGVILLGLALVGVFVLAGLAIIRTT